MGLGWSGAYGAAGAAKGLRQLVLDRIEAEERAKADKQQAIENALKTRQLDQGDTLTRLRIAEMSANAAGAREDRQMTLANAVADQIPEGTELAPDDRAVSLMHQGGRGALLQPQNTLASRQTAGGMTLPGGEAPPEAVSQTQAVPPKLRGYLKLPSAKQLTDKATREDRLADNARQDQSAEMAAQARVMALEQAAERLRMQGEVNAANIMKAQADTEAAQARAEATRAKTSGADGGGISPYAAERNTRNLASVDALLKKVGHSTTGVGSLLAYLPATDARNFDAEVRTLKANIGFGELTAMREASKTGGALGNVSNVELDLLTSALGALDTGQSPANFRAQLEQIRDSIQRWQDAVKKHAPNGAPQADRTLSAEELIKKYSQPAGTP